MAASIPASLKTPDLTRFAHRAAQLEKPKPAVAYWCNYWILNQILTKNLHNADAEALTYTTTLMDKVEQFKTANSSNDAVVDDVAGKAYVEQFALETFARADNAVRANKASKVTADTYSAAATFLDLLAIWGPLDAEIAAKTKYAKFHALRIVKAVKAGEDPNLSNPKQEPPPEEALPQLDPNDAEVRALEGKATVDPHKASALGVLDEADGVQARLAKTSSLDESLHPPREQSEAMPSRPSVIEVPDEAHHINSDPAHVSSKDESLRPSSVPFRPDSTPGTGTVSPLATQDVASFYNSTHSEVSPLEPPNERRPSIGGNYFPLTPPPSHLPPGPQAPSQDKPFDIPAAPSAPPSTFDHPTPESTQTPVLPSNPNPNSNPQTHPTLPTILPNLTPHSAPLPPPPQPPPPPPPQSRPPVVFTPPANQPHPPPATITQPILRAMNPVTPTPTPIPATAAAPVVVDEEAMMRAQKHARWAISALNFEDVPTAIRELQGALAVLGAR